jgi:hypothetical protein
VHPFRRREEFRHLLCRFMRDAPDTGHRQIMASEGLRAAEAICVDA